ncbi:class I SAM-dependent methyltransferase [Aquimarina algiphila]|uniref:class I SAM-dependent methyltransferase n=1 Tax=Aquimarina algiphila TaxID=2047982 RepID=UPI0023303D95|nr:class I SAM-dependent methyltransferase [Aquimarina algiphila]
MNTKILHKEVQEFILEKSNNSIDLSILILSGSPFKDITIQELAQQIQGNRKTKRKLPLWHTKSRIYYPPTLNLEQTSSEATALYKSNLISGKTLIDLTGGFGVDDYYFAKKIKKVIHCEFNASLSKITTHNFKILEVNNITTIHGDGLEILKNQSTVDWIYIDPSRRHDSKGKVFFLEDCLPNVPNNLELLFGKSSNIMIKTSPLLDIHTGIKALQYVKEIHIVAVDNEVKELIWILNKGYTGEIGMITVNIQKSGNQEFSFFQNEEIKQPLNLSAPKSYLYEPNAAILKSGGFLIIGNTLGLKKLHNHSHLYTSEKIIDFPGRSFEILIVYPYQKKVIAKSGITKANITTRNFPESVALLRKKLKIKDGGDDYLFFTTDHINKKIMIHCKKVSRD